jgi:integrase
MVTLRIQFIQRLLEFWTNRGKLNLPQLVPKDMSDFVLSVSEQCKHSMGNALAHLRAFSAFLNSNCYEVVDFLPALRMRVSKRRKQLTGFTPEESRRMLDSAKSDNPVDKRNFAMMALAQYTGLRSGDIITLKLTDIDWHKEEIRIVQNKTGKPLVVPLVPAAGNAIAEYLLYYRPETSSTCVFVRSLAPFQQMNTWGSACNITRKHIRLAQIENASERKLGFHGFRRALGTWMLETEAPKTLISQTFGQVDPDTIKSYLAMDTEKLRCCAISLAGIGVTQEELR